MQKSVYERYGLSSNPFRDLSSESLDNVDIFHVVQGVDGELARIKEEVFDKENKAVIAVLGGLGAGKTERLLLSANEAKQNKNFYLIKNMTFETHWVVRGILESIIKNNNLSGFSRIFSAPKWYKKIKKTMKKSKQAYNSEDAGHVIAQALNENTPSFLLINDFHNLSKAADAERFLHVLHVLVDHIDQGVMIMLSSDQKFFETLMQRHPSLNERINRKIILPSLTDDEANLMIAKRLLEKRIVEDVESLYPFTPEAISFLNKATKGNPRRLLKLADIVIDFAANKRAIMIEGSLVREVLKLGKNQQLSIKLEEKDSVVMPNIIPTYENTDKIKKRKRFKKSSIIPFSNVALFHGSSEIPENLQAKDEDITKNVVKNDFSLNSLNEKPVNKNHKSDQVSKKKPKTKKTKKTVKKKTKLPQKKQKVIKNNVNLKPSKNARSQESLNPDGLVKVKCPLCFKVFAMDINDETEDIRCPYCDFMGSVS